MERTINPNQQYPRPIEQGMLMYLMVAFTTILAATAIWFLVRNRAAFVLANS
jgi:hypothetical protein